MVDGYERAANEIIPAARIVIARQLKEWYNMTESSIAKVLGVAQAAVSKYLNSDGSKIVAAASKEMNTARISASLERIAGGDQEELKRCICEVCGAMNKFDCKFSSANGAGRVR